MRKTELAEQISKFAAKQRGAFTTDQLRVFVQQRYSAFDDESRLFRVAMESKKLFSDFGCDDDDLDTFLPRHCFFKGAEFRVNPLPEEVEGGFLIPGHRFVPFINGEIFPGDAVVTLPDGSRAETRMMSFPPEIALRCLVYYGEKGFVSYLINESESNADRFQSALEKPFDMTVFDLREFYRQSGFKAGDALMFKVEDWLKGELSVQRIPASGRDVDFAGIHDWVTAMREGYDVMCEIQNLSFDCTEQIAWMYFFAAQKHQKASVLVNPPLTVPDLFRKQKDLSIKSLYNISFFWPTDVPVEQRVLEEMDADDSEPETELDGLFQLLRVSLDTEDAEAYMRDHIACGGNDPEAVLDRALAGRTLFFPDESFYGELFDLWNELWLEVRERYNPAEDGYRRMRSVFLGLNDRCLQILRDLDKSGIPPEEIIASPAYVKLSEMSEMIHTVLQMTNQDGKDQSEIEMPLPIDETAKMIEKAFDMIAADLLPARSPKKKRKSIKGPVYQLKITLRQSRPAIWRRVLMPSEVPLEMLHGVIQAAFGWHDCHLHQFVAGRRFYQPGGDEDGFMLSIREVLDSNAFPLSDLLRREKDKLVYEYDFGDGWEHQVVLEKILDPVPGQKLPICLKGMRACPPEDCGGLWGYYQMLETLDGPDCEEKRQLLEWTCGPIDPEAFDLAEANRRLKRLP